MRLEDFSAGKVNTDALVSQEDRQSVQNSPWHKNIQGLEVLSDFGSQYKRNPFDSIGSFKRANEGTAENNFAAFLTQFESLKTKSINGKSINGKSINAKESIGKSIGSFQ